MATVYSLVCWGGKDGKTVTMTVASPCVVSLANHGLRDGTGVVFSTTGALPIGITAGTTYYSRSTASGTFNLYDTSAHAVAGGSTGIVNTSGSQSGTHTAKGAYYLGLTTEQKARYGESGSERIYDSIKSWRDARYGNVNAYDTEICEIGEAFIEYATTSIQVNLACVEAHITPRVNGVLTAASWKVSGISGGYVCRANGNITAIQLMNYRFSVSEIVGMCGGNTSISFRLSSLLCSIYGCVVVTDGSYTGCTGIQMNSTFLTAYNNLVVGIGGSGFSFPSNTGDNNIVYNNTAHNCTTGFSAGTTATKGAYYNNLSVGNTTNWSAAPPSMQGGSNNAGQSGDTPWGTDAVTTMTTAHYDSTTFLPTSDSPVINAGVVPYNGVPFDANGDARPNYESATYPDNHWDIGCFEYDHGEGLAPQTVPISITGMASGSEIAIYKASDMSEILAPQSTTGAYSGTYTYTGDVNIIVRVRKGTSATRYLPYEYAGTITSTGFRLVVSQIVDTIAQ